jgi:2-polyprenyl-6-methoxyphenol hydroxylase-like FAD-dependent oxidoreductase
MSDSASHDVVIHGGGLAGLTLALQLTQRLPGLDVV